MRHRRLCKSRLCHCCYRGGMFSPSLPPAVGRLWRSSCQLLPESKRPGREVSASLLVSSWHQPKVKCRLHIVRGPLPTALSIASAECVRRRRSSVFSHDVFLSRPAQTSCNPWLHSSVCHGCRACGADDKGDDPPGAVHPSQLLSSHQGVCCGPGLQQGVHPSRMAFLCIAMCME